MRPYYLRAVLAATLLAVSAGALASGSYTSRPPVPPGKISKLDRAQYRLGQRLFDGRVEPTPAGVAAAAQETRLEALQAMLPPRTAAKKHLPSLAGRLSDSQLEALEYYVRRRYPAK